MSILQRLRRIVRRIVVAWERGEVDRLSRDLLRHYDREDFREATGDARRLLTLQKRLVGDRHPDYAVGLSNLSLLHHLQGQRAEAEAFLQRAYQICRDVLGDGHPDVLSLLKRLENLRLSEASPRAEPVVAQAPEPPPREPETPAVTIAAPPPALDDDQARELAELRSSFADLGARLLAAARLLLTNGTPPAAEFVASLAERRRAFEAVRDRVRRRAERSLGPRSGGTPGNIDEVAALLAEVAAAERERAAREQERRLALARLDRVLRLAHRVSAEREPLGKRQAEARLLRVAIESAPWSRLPAEAARLAGGEHPFARLLALVEERETLSDERWAQLHRAVKNAHGPRLAAAAARGRLLLTAQVEPPAVGEPVRPGPALDRASKRFSSAAPN